MKIDQKFNQVIYRSGPSILPKMKKIQKVVGKLLRKQKSEAQVAAAPVAYEQVKEHQFTPCVPGRGTPGDSIMFNQATHSERSYD